MSVKKCQVGVALPGLEEIGALDVAAGGVGKTPPFPRWKPEQVRRPDTSPRETTSPGSPVLTTPARLHHSRPPQTQEPRGHRSGSPPPTLIPCTSLRMSRCRLSGRGSTPAAPGLSFRGCASVLDAEGLPRLPSGRNQWTSSEPEAKS